MPIANNYLTRRYSSSETRDHLRQGQKPKLQRSKVRNEDNNGLKDGQSTDDVSKIEVTRPHFLITPLQRDISKPLRANPEKFEIINETFSLQPA